MNSLVTISEASNLLGVSVSTLRRWEREGKIIPERTNGKHRRYNIEQIAPNLARKKQLAHRKVLAYARVSSHDQKADLDRQKKVLEMYCASNGWTYDLISDLGSGMNYNKKGLRRLINEIISGEAGRLVITHKDRLLRFGAELVFALCEAKQVEVVILNHGEDTTFEEDLAKDVLEIITVFSARLYGSRSNKNRKLLEKLEKAIEEDDTPCS